MEQMLYREELEMLSETLDRDLYPETAEAIARILEAENLSAYGIATELMTADMEKKMDGDIARIVKACYLQAVEEGDDDAMCDLGAFYYDNRGGEQNYGKSVTYYKMAADRGNRRARENLGYCYYYGRSVPIDYEMAFRYFLKGALVGEVTSMYKIGDMYRNGYFVEKDARQAFDIYEHCIKCLDEASTPVSAGPVLLRLAEMHLRGEGTEKDCRTALLTYQQAERFLFDMVSNGEHSYQKSLAAAVAGQTAARKGMNLPDLSWAE